MHVLLSSDFQFVHEHNNIPLRKPKSGRLKYINKIVQCIALRHRMFPDSHGLAEVTQSTTDFNI